MNGIAASKRGLPNPEAGNTLIIALLVLFLLTSLGVSYVAVTKGDKQGGEQHREPDRQASRQDVPAAASHLSSGFVATQLMKI